MIAMARKAGRLSKGDEDFYSSLAAGVSDGSDTSEVDTKELARSLGGLDDMEDDILGTLSTKKKAVASKQPLSKTLPAKSSMASSATKTAAAKKDTFNIDDIMADDGDTFNSILSSRPKTTDDSRKSSLSSEVRGDAKSRPATTGQPRNVAKKYDFGDFDEDDPLGGLDLSDDEKPVKQNKPTASQNKVARPVTRSGRRPQEEPDSQLPIKSRGKQSKVGAGGDDGSDWDASSASSTQEKAAAEPKSAVKAATPARQPPKKKEAVTFSDDEDDLDLGLDDSPAVKSKEKVTEKSGGGIMDSLFGNSSSVEKHLQRPGTGGSQKDYSLGDSIGSRKISDAGVSETSHKKISDEDEDIFGSYAPSAMSSRPGTGRSVRFEDEESTTQRRPATADAASSNTDDWLGLGAGNKQKKRPLGLASTIDFSAGSADDDWLEMATNAASRPKTAPVNLDKKPPRTPDRKPSVIGGGKLGGGDDWLTELTAKVDDDAEFAVKPANLSRASAEKPFSRQSSIDSAANTSRRASLVKQNSSDDWLGLGEEKVTAPAKAMDRSKLAPKSNPKPSPVMDDSDWLGLGTSPPTKDDDTEQWIKSAKLRRQKSTDSIFDDEPVRRGSGSFSLSNSKPSPQSSTPKLPWENGDGHKPKPAASGGIFDDNQRQASPARPVSTPKSLPVFQPMFVTPEVSLTPQQQQIDPNTWNREQESLVQHHNSQLEQMQQQFNQMMDIRRQQQQAALEQQRKLAEDAFKLQQQHLQASSLGIGPSPVFPTGLPPTKQSEIQLDNVELEGKVRRLEHEKSHLDSLIESLKRRHQEEITGIETSNKSRILLVEESYQRREFRLREELEQLSSESLAKLRHAEEEKAAQLSSQYRKIDELEKNKSYEIERQREQHRQEIERMKQDHHSAIEILRKSKEQELEGLLSTTSNPQSIQFLMEQMKQNAAGLSAMQFNIGRSHQVTLDERELAINSRDQQLKVLQECLLKQQDENDKERSRLQELLAKMEIQLREQERQLHQEKWTVSQEKSKLSALQTSVEQERTMLNDQLTRERSELGRAKDSFLAEQRQAMVQLADERRLLSEERSQLTISQRLASEKESEESLRQSQGSAKYEGLIKSLESDREDLAKRLKSLSADECKLSSERTSLEHERDFVRKEQDRLGELAKKIQTEMNSIESFSRDCVEKNKEGTQALLESRRQDAVNQSRLSEVTSRLEELKAAERRFAEERLQIQRDRKQMESLKNMQLCAGCKQPITRNPYFSLSTPILSNRTSPLSVGVVAPQQLDFTDPNILQYKIQADQDSDFLNEESAYLDALKYSSYHSKPVS